MLFDFLDHSHVNNVFFAIDARYITLHYPIFKIDLEFYSLIFIQHTELLKSMYDCISLFI